MNDDDLTRAELLDKLEGLRHRIADMERQDTDRRQSEKARFESLQAEKKKLEEELQLRFAQLKASEEEMKQTRRQSQELGIKTEDLRSRTEQAEKLLQESDNHYRHLVANIPGLLAIQDVQAKKYVYWNRDVGWSGYTLDEWNKLPHDAKRKLIHPDDLPRYLKLYKEWEEAGADQTLKLIYRLRHKDGHFRWLEAYTFKEYADDGGVIAQIEISWDITERMEAETALKGRDERYAFLAANTDQIVYRLDKERNFSFVTPSYCETFGKKETELLGKRFTPPIHQEDYDATDKALDAATREPFISHVEHRTLTRKGWKWFGWSFRAVRDGAGKVEAIVAVGSDISERKQLGEELLKVREQLDQRVSQRTTELTEANDNLVKQIEGYKRAEAELLENRANIQMLLASLKEFVFVLDPAGRIQHINPVVLDKLGKNEDEVLRTIEMLGQANEAQRRTRSNLQMLFNALEDLVFVIDSKGKILFANNSAQKRLEYSEDELLKLNLMEIYPPNRRDEAGAILADAITGKARYHSIPIITRDKTIIPAETRLNLGRWDNNNALIISCRDTAERQIVERRREDAGRKFRLMAEEAAVGFCILQGDVVRYANPQWTATLGYTTEDMMVWSSPDLENIVHPDDRDEYIRQHRRARMSSEAERYTFRAVTKSGAVKWVNLYSRSVTFENSDAELLTLVDINDFLQAEQAKLSEEMSQVGSARSEALELLAGAVAHDFNELLTIITGHSQLGVMTLHESDPIRRDFDEIAKAAENGSKLTWKLLTYAGRHDWNPTALDLNESVGSMQGVLKRILGNQLTLEIIPGVDLKSVKVDAAQLEQVLANLAMNSREATSGTGRVTIKLENAEVTPEQVGGSLGVPAGSYVRISFADTGKGIPKEIQSRIFDPFFTTRADSKGAGLGLSIVRGVVKKAGGFVSVSSPPNSGATIEIYLPVCAAEEPVAVAREPRKVSVKGRGEQVLVVEDDDAVRGMAAQILKWHGYTVLEARSGMDAMQMCEKMTHPVDVVVSDVFMPGMSGTELVGKLKKMWTNVKVLYISGATADKALSPDTPLLRKPFPPNELVKRVEELLAG